ncbi:MAG: helix-turn-helix domain-containing protein [Patescibacteria group bacterium]|nr:helix-turn-helix domain-containing protein [Patescibacteria group bacterium]MDE2438743.1 helix-turn-helix domain-containing protein [Patescibacteria group bacterium]
MNDQYFIQEESHSNFTIIPNIITEMGLSLSEIGLYFFFKKIAGEGGQCFYSLSRLAEMTGSCENTIRKSKANLEEKGLIRIIKRKNEESKKNETDVILICDIWSINQKHFDEKKNKKFNTGSPHEPPLVHHTNHPGSKNAPPLVQKMNHPGSKNEPYKEPIEKEPKKEEKENAYKPCAHATPSEPKKEKVSETLNGFPCFFSSSEKKAIEKKGFSPERIKKVVDYALENEFWAPKLKKSGDIFKHFDSINAQVDPDFEDLSEDDRCKLVIKQLRKKYPLAKLVADEYSVYDQCYQRTFPFSMGYKELKRRILECWGLSE